MVMVMVIKKEAKAQRRRGQADEDLWWLDKVGGRMRLDPS